MSIWTATMHDSAIEAGCCGDEPDRIKEECCTEDGDCDDDCITDEHECRREVAS